METRVEMEQIKNEIQKAELVLIGIGEEMGADLSRMKEDSKYADFLYRLEKEDELHWMIPYVEKIYLEEKREERIIEAYTALQTLLDGKNYFIVSTCTDDYIYDANLDSERIVTPCGGYGKEQCQAGCSQTLRNADRGILDSVHRCLAGEIEPETLVRPLCERCGNSMVFNNIYAEKYEESGYMEQWNIYKKWLQGTVNRRLCVLELGVGMKYPTVIRWPIEKIVFFNQKAVLFRIHSKLYQLSEEIKDRGYSVKEKPVDFLMK